MREYIRALWKHDFPDQPVELHDAMLPARAVPRMVEIFAGRAEDGDLPTATEIRALTAEASPNEFEVIESTQAEFEMAFRE